MTAVRTAQALATSPPLPSEENPGRMENRMPTLPKKYHNNLSGAFTPLNLSASKIIKACVEITDPYSSILNQRDFGGEAQVFLIPCIMHLHEATPTQHYSLLQTTPWTQHS